MHIHVPDALWDKPGLRQVAPISCLPRTSSAAPCFLQPPQASAQHHTQRLQEERLAALQAYLEGTPIPCTPRALEELSKEVADLRVCGYAVDLRQLYLSVSNEFRHPLAGLSKRKEGAHVLFWLDTDACTYIESVGGRGSGVGMDVGGIFACLWPACDRQAASVRLVRSLRKTTCPRNKRTWKSKTMQGC